METNHSDESTGESNAKRPKIETDASTTSEPVAKDPFLSLPSDIIAKIITYIPIAQWPALELLDTNFQADTLIAWRQLRSINLDREFIIKSENPNDQSAFGKSVESIMQKLVTRSIFLTSLSGVDMRLNAASNPVVIQLLAEFEHLQSITLGDVKLFNEQRGILLEDVVEFLESTRSRSSLKELKLCNVFQWGDRATILDQFAMSFANGREIQSPLKLEKFSFTPFTDSLGIRLDTMDTTRLIDVRVGKATIEPDQLTNLIERAPMLQRIELSFLQCSYSRNRRQHLQANNQLLTALASHENLTAIKIGGTGLGFAGLGVQCMNLVPQFIQTLKSIGRRGRLRKLTLDEGFVNSTNIMEEICATIRAYIPYLQSITLWVRDGMSDASVLDVVNLANLEEMHITNVGGEVTANTIEKIAQLSQLKRLALGVLNVDNAKSLKYLADAKLLRDVRIRSANLISADVFEKWADGLAPNLDILMLEGIGAITEHDENALIHILEKAVRLRVLILDGTITDRVLMAIAKSCRQLEILGVRSTDGITVQCLQEIVDRCTRLKRMGGFEDEIHRNQLQLSKYRKIGDVDMRFWKYNFDSDEYD